MTCNKDSPFVLPVSQQLSRTDDHETAMACHESWPSSSVLFPNRRNRFVSAMPTVIAYPDGRARGRSSLSVAIFCTKYFAFVLRADPDVQRAWHIS